ncbi:MAG: carbohydrate kinase [Mucilaginibacter sp.]
MKNHILCFGEVLWDNFADGKKPGGAPMNVAQHLAQQGLEVSLVSRTGDDSAGKKLVEFLKKADLYGKYMQRDDELPTCEVTVTLDENNQATYTIPQPVSWDNIKVESGLKKHARKAAAIVFGSLACRSKKSRNTLQTLLDETSALKVFDVNLRAPHYDLGTIEILAAKANIVKMNEEEAALLIGGTHEQLKDNIEEFQKKYHAKTIVVTRGDKGAMVWHDEKFYEHPGFEVAVVDTVGAGDAFLATFINGLLKNKPIDDILEKACAIGAFVATKRGANPAYNKDEIKAIKGVIAA